MPDRSPSRPSEATRRGSTPVIFLNVNAVRSGLPRGAHYSRPYLNLCKLLKCGVIDRTRTLDCGVEYQVLDPIPTCREASPTFAHLCDAEADALVDEALSSGRRLQVLWSGGIDSTTALVAILAAIQRREANDILDVLLSPHSISEYPRFYRTRIHDRIPTIFVSTPIGRYLNSDNFTVTGEHGDQLFGSYLLKDLVDDGRAFLSYQEALPAFFAARLGSSVPADRLMEYIEPQVRQAPFEVKDAYDFLWWLNYSLKWQAVSLRMSVFRGSDVRKHFQNTRHFFRTVPFQQWSLTNPEGRRTADWRSYKQTAKDYIFQHTNDVQYLRNKTKHASLKNVFIDRDEYPGGKVAAHMDQDFVVNLVPYERARNVRG